MAYEVSVLENGITVVSDFIPEACSVAINVGVNVGSRYEPVALNGMSHFLEHMAFKGTKRRTARQIAEEMDAVGGYLNAYTDREQTVYCARVLKENLPLAVDVLADILQHSLFEAEEVQRECQVILQEIAQSIDTPDDIVFDHYQDVAFPHQPIGRSILGTSDIIQTFTPDALHEYLRTYYRGAEMVVTAAGHVQHAEFVTLVREAFTEIEKQRTSEILPATYQGGIKVDARDLEQVHLVLGFPSCSYHSDDYYTTQMLSIILGGGMSSRLFQEVREKRGLVYSVYSFMSSYTDTGMFGIYAGTGESDIPELLPVLRDEIQKMSLGVSEEELARARAQVKAGLLMSQESSSVRADELVRNFLSYGRQIPHAEILEKIARVEVSDIKKRMEQLMHHAPSLAVVGAVSNPEVYYQEVGDGALMFK